MRRVALLCLGILCGTLAVSGQDGEGDALDREIDRLKKLLEDRIAKATPPADEEIVPRIHDVADLCARIWDRPQRFEDLEPSWYQPPEDEAGPEPTCRLEIDSLIEMIRFGIEPLCWESEGMEVEPKNGRLFVKAVPRVHGKIERFLAWCREATDRRVAVEIAVVPLAEADAGVLSGAIDLTAEEAQRLVARAKGTLTLAGWNGRVLGGREGREIAYVADIDIEVVDKKPVADPVTHRIFSGSTAQVQACLDEGGGAIVHCRLEFSRIDEPLSSHATPHGNIELPRKRLTRVMTSFWAPLERTVVAGGCTVGDDPCVILVTVRRKT